MPPCRSLDAPAADGHCGPSSSFRQEREQHLADLTAHLARLQQYVQESGAQRSTRTAPVEHGEPGLDPAGPTGEGDPARMQVSSSSNGEQARPCMLPIDGVSICATLYDFLVLVMMRAWRVMHVATRVLAVRSAHPAHCRLCQKWPLTSTLSAAS
jgi:hypothetical protein